MSDCLRLSHPPLAHLNQRSPTTARQTKPQKRVPNDVCQAYQASRTKVRDIWNDYFKGRQFLGNFLDIWNLSALSKRKLWTLYIQLKFSETRALYEIGVYPLTERGHDETKLNWKYQILPRWLPIYIQLKQQNILSKDQKSSCLFNYHHCTG